MTARLSLPILSVSFLEGAEILFPDDVANTTYFVRVDGGSRCCRGLEEAARKLYRTRRSCHGADDPAKLIQSASKMLGEDLLHGVPSKHSAHHDREDEQGTYGGATIVPQIVESVLERLEQLSAGHRQYACLLRKVEQAIGMLPTSIGEPPECCFRMLGSCRYRETCKVCPAVSTILAFLHCLIACVGAESPESHGPECLWGACQNRHGNAWVLA